MTTEEIDYESLTVPELKELALERGIEIPHDARKAEIIDALQTQDKQLGITGANAAPSQTDNIYEFQMTSIDTGLMTHDDFWRLKLTS